MDPVIRSAVVYLFLMLVFRILDKRSLSEITTFDFLLLLIVGEATQQALLGSDFSITNALLIIIVLVGIDLVIAKVKQKWPAFEKAAEGVPLIIVAEGKALKLRMKHAGVDEGDVLEAARMKHGLERMEQVRYAIQERDGKISIIPYQKEG